MISRFLLELQTLAGEEALQKNYLLAVSGGADSMVAATLFHEAGIRFAMAHCNFHLRGDDSNRDMRFVQQVAEKWQVPFLLREFDTLGLQKNSGKSVEMIARELRYDWFSEVSADFDHLVTAHQATDATETVLLNLCRGTGLKGLCGIPPVNGKVIRPMLIFTAHEIRQYAENHHVEYLEDYTNHDEAIARNRIRHSVIPQMEVLNPQFLHTNAHSRTVLQRQYIYYQKHIGEEKRRVLQQKDHQYLINRSLLEQSNDKELVLYEILIDFDFPPEVIEKLAENVSFQSGKQFFSEKYILLIDRDFLIVQPKEKVEKAIVNIESLEQLKQYFDIEEFEYQKDMTFDKNPDILYVPKEKLTFPLQIRSWQQGDYFYPLGVKGRQKLSDFFTDHKIDRFTKERIRLLCADNQIVWIVGWRSDDRFKVTKTNAECYKLSPLSRALGGFNHKYN